MYEVVECVCEWVDGVWWGATHTIFSRLLVVSAQSASGVLNLQFLDEEHVRMILQMLSGSKHTSLSPVDADAVLPCRVWCELRKDTIYVLIHRTRY